MKDPRSPQRMPCARCNEQAQGNTLKGTKSGAWGALREAEAGKSGVGGWIAWPEGWCTEKTVPKGPSQKFSGLIGLWVRPLVLETRRRVAQGPRGKLLPPRKRRGEICE